LVVVVSAGPAGFKASVFQRAFDMATEIAIPVIRSSLKALNLPPVTGSGSVSIIGTIHYTISNVVIKDFNFDAPVITPWNGAGLMLKAGNLRASMGLDFKWEKKSFPRASGSGSATAGISGAGAAFFVTFVIGADGRPTAKVSNAIVTIGEFDVKVTRGSVAWLYNWLLGKLKDSIKSAAEKAMSTSIVPVFAEQVNQFLASLPLAKFPINEFMEFDMSMVALPTVTTTRVTVPLLGAVAPKGLPPAFLPTDDLPDMVEDGSNPMAEVVVSDYVLKTAALTMEKAGRLNFTLTPENYPTSPVPLNTANFAKLVPLLQEKFPNTPLRLVVGPRARPSAGSSSSRGAILGDISFEVDFIAGSTYCFTAVIDLSFWAGIYLEDNRLKLKVDGASPQVAISKSAIGEVSPAGLKQSVTDAILGSFLPKINAYTTAGFPLPVPSFLKAVQLKVTYKQGYFAVSGDIKKI